MTRGIDLIYLCVHQPQVCMKEGAKGTQDAFYFLSSGCAPLRSGLGIQGLLLPPVLAAHMASSIDAGEAIDIGNEIMWDDHDASDKKLEAAAFVSHMSLLKVSRDDKLPRVGPGSCMPAHDSVM